MIFLGGILECCSSGSILIKIIRIKILHAAEIVVNYPSI